MSEWRSIARGHGRRWLAAAAAAALCVAGAGCSLLPKEQVTLGSGTIQLPPAPAPPTIKVAQGNVVLSAVIAGQVQSTHIQNLYFSAGGRVTSVDVQNGESVQAGQVLASLDVSSIQYNIENANLAIARDQLALQQLQAQDAASPPTNQNEAQQQALQQQQDTLALQQDQANLGNLQKQLAQDEVVAPFSGVVNDVAVSPGDQVQSYQVVMDISDPSSEAFIADVDSTTVTELAVGDAFTMTMTSQPNHTFHGKIASIVIPTTAEITAAEESGNPNGVPQPNCTLDVTDYTGQPILGATFSATIDIQQATNVLYLPSDTIHQFNGGAYVDVYSKGVISEVPVTIGLQGDTDTQIMSGLKLGEEVVEQ